MRKDIFGKAKQALAALEAARHGLPGCEFEESLAAASGAALLDQHPTLKPYVMSLRPVAEAQSSNMAANEWTDGPRWGVEHNHAVDIESADVEDAESAEEFIEQLCEEARVERQLLANDLARWGD